MELTVWSVHIMAALHNRHMTHGTSKVGRFI